MERTVLELGSGALIFPMFMAGGWFTRINIPSRLHAVGAKDFSVLEPMGCEEEMQSLAVAVVLEALEGQDLKTAEVIIAAHGSFKSRVPSDIALKIVGRVASAGVGRVAAGFIDQDPKLADLTGFGARSVCLPYFAAAGGHVTVDLPLALDSAGFQGRILPPLGLDPRVHSIIASAINRAVPSCALTCRHQMAG